MFGGDKYAKGGQMPLRGRFLLERPYERCASASNANRISELSIVIVASDKINSPF